jgi:hypothetical protein
MDCSFINKNLFAIVENTLSPDESLQADLHIRSCPECSRIVTEFRETIGLIDNGRSMEINPFISTRILERLDSAYSSRTGKKEKILSHLLQPAVMTFSLFLALLIGFSLGKTGMNNISGKQTDGQDIQSVRSELFIPDMTDEDKTPFLNP